MSLGEAKYNEFDVFFTCQNILRRYTDAQLHHIIPVVDSTWRRAKLQKLNRVGSTLLHKYNLWMNSRRRW